MRKWLVGLLMTAAVIALSLIPKEVAGQVSSTGIARTRDGHPDLSGIWQVMNTAAWDVEPHIAQPGVPAGVGVIEGDQIPYTPAALAKKKDNYKNRATLDPESKCFLPGVPRAMYMPFQFQIVQTPTLVTFLFEYAHAVRSVFMNTPHPPGHIDWWMGDSRGKWERDALVIDVTDFSEETWFDRAGNFHTDGLHVIERLLPIDPDHINYEATIEDPKVFTRSWKMRMLLYRHKESNVRLLEYECYSFDSDAEEIYRRIHTP